jgi:hypothetical protein
MLLKKKKNFKFIGLVLIIGVLFSCGKDDGGTPNDDDPPTGFLGELEYVKTFGGSGEDEATAILQTSDGSYMVFGSTRSNDGDITDKAGIDADYWLLKLSSEGELIWSKTYGGSEDDKGSRISKTNDGGYLLSGYSTSNDGDVSGNEGFHDYWIVKVNSEGAIQWDLNFGFPGSDQAHDAFQTTDGGYFITGFFDVSACGVDLCPGDDLWDGQDPVESKNGQHGVGEYWAIKLDGNGTKQWRRYFGGSNNDRSYDALQTADGGFLMVGASESADFDITDDKGSYDYWAVRITETGGLVWTKSFGGSEIDVGYAVSRSNDGNYILVGDSRSEDKDVTNPLGNADAWAVKFSDDGNLIWQKNYGGDQFESGRSIVPMSDGNYLIAGSTRSANGDITVNRGQNDAWIYKINEQGALVFQISAGGSSLDFATAALETPDNKIVAVGNTESNDFDIPMNRGIKDVLLIKIK